VSSFPGRGKVFSLKLEYFQRKWTKRWTTRTTRTRTTTTTQV